LKPFGTGYAGHDRTGVDSLRWILPTFLACGSGSERDTSALQEAHTGEPADTVEERPAENVPATVAGDPDLDNGLQIYLNSCTACHPQYASPFEWLIPAVTDLEIETAIRDGKKGVPLAIGERSPPDGALRLNLTDQDIVDIIGYMRQEFGDYVP
jgi:mono/diheme cytochrome c family protein